MAPSTEFASAPSVDFPRTLNEKLPIVLDVQHAPEADLTHCLSSSPNPTQATPASRFELEDHHIDVQPQLRVGS
jgi:hypothetical protein